MKLDCIAELDYRPLGPDRGEDAYCYDCSRRELHAFAVLDGCGGSGAWEYPEYHNATGAFVAAQSMAKRFHQWAAGITPADMQSLDNLALSFHEATWSTLQQMKAACQPMGVSGSLVKSFPCTLSAALVTEGAGPALCLTAINVGDSRVYYLTPDEGLVQLTQDDSRGNPDPLLSLRNNASLSNLLNADKDYRVRITQVEVPEPCAILCATDGVFGFVRSPMDFEHLLLSAIQEANTVQEMEQLFRQKIVQLTGDDSTCITAFYGWNTYAQIKKSLRARYSDMKRVVSRLDAIADPIQQEAQVQRLWDEYKQQAVYYMRQG